MSDLSRHAPVGRPRRRAGRDQARGLPDVYASRKRRPLPDLYITDRAEARKGGSFLWFFSTCLAAGFGALAIAAVVLGSLGTGEERSLVTELRRPKAKAEKGARQAEAVDGLNWTTPKFDRLQTTAGAASTKHVVQESINQRRGNREYIHHRFYARIAVRLGSVHADAATAIPPFNPFKLYGATGGGDPNARESDSGHAESNDVAVKVVELIGAILPTEDGQEMDNQEVADLVKSADESVSEAGIRSSFAPEGASTAATRPASLAKVRAAPEPLAPNTTVLEKSTLDVDEITEEAEGRQVKLKIARGESLPKLLERMGADPWQAREMTEKARSVLPDGALTPGLDIELTLVPALTDPSKVEPARFSIFGAAGEHKATVRRNAAGEFVASATPIEASIARAEGEEPEPAAASLYASLYHAGLAQGLSPETILQILKIHVYETDFRRRARGSDSIDLFFDLKDEGRAADNPPAELLSTAITVGGETQRYFRFRTQDGVVDYYDLNGNNSRKFLMRKPVRSDEVRFISGYGLRRHPILNVIKMHTGVDWAGAPGTPILAAGGGVIEEAGYKGQNGNYIRIRHANGYQTTYSHMLSRFAPEVRIGARVRQGQTIGFLGNTGLSTGAHLHFEILVGNRFVDPMSIQVPKERRLTGKALADFQRERARIEDLMTRPPVRVAQIDGR